MQVRYPIPPAAALGHICFDQSEILGEIYREVIGAENRGRLQYQARFRFAIRGDADRKSERLGSE